MATSNPTITKQWAVIASGAGTRSISAANVAAEYAVTDDTNPLDSSFYGHRVYPDSGLGQTITMEAGEHLQARTASRPNAGNDSAVVVVTS